MERVSEWLTAALAPQKWDVGGFILWRLTVWHTFALERVGNAYLCNGDPTINDLAGLMLHAQCRAQESMRLFTNTRLTLRRMRDIHRRLTRMGEEKQRECHLMALDYVKACMVVPEHYRPESGEKGDHSRAPYQLHLLRCLCRVYGVPLEQAWDMPYSWARALYDVDQDAEGARTLVDESELVRIERNLEACKR